MSSADFNGWVVVSFGGVPDIEDEQRASGEVAFLWIAHGREYASTHITPSGYTLIRRYACVRQSESTHSPGSY